MESMSKMNVFKKYYLYSVSLYIILTGVLFDTFLKEVYFVTINDLSIYYTSLVTIGAISATLITIVSSSLDNRVLSFKLKEILNFKNKYLSIQAYVPANIVLILFGTIAYMINLTNTLFTIFFIILMFTLIYSLYIWMCATDSNFPIELAKAEFERLSGSTDQENRTFDMLFKAFKQTYDTDSSEYLIVEELMRDNYSKTNQTYNISKIREIFDYIISKQGPTKAFSIIIYITSKNDKEYKNYEIKKIIIDFAFEMQNASQVKIDNYDIINFYKSITKQYNLFGSYSTLLLYKSFSMVIDNKRIDHEARLLYAEQYIGLLCQFISTYKVELVSIQQRVFLELYMDYILLKSNNKNTDLNLHGHFVNSLTSITLFVKERLFETLLLTYFSEYMLSTSINFKYQDEPRLVELKKISIIKHIKRLDYVFIQTATKLYKDINKYLYLGKVLNKGPFLEDLNYEFIEFLLINSFIFDSHRKWAQTMERIIQDTTIEITLRLFRLFDKKQESLVEDYRNHIRFISIESLKNRNDFEQLSETYFRILNRRIAKDEAIFGKIDDNAFSSRKLDLISSIDRFMNDLPHKPLEDKLDCVDKFVEFIIEKDDIDNDTFFADIAMTNIKSTLFEFLKEKGSKIPFYYDNNSYEKLINSIIRNSYDTHNSNLDLEVEFNANEQTAKLWNTIKANLSHFNLLNEYGVIFYNSSKFNMSLELIDFTLRDLTGNEISTFLDDYEIHPNKYSFRDALYSRFEAEEFVTNKYQKIIIQVTICINFGPDDLVIVEQLY